MLKEIAVGGALAVLAVGAVIAVSAIGLRFDRSAAPYAKETERLTYQNSVARQQGANNGVAQDCANMQSNTGAEKLAFARLVLTDAAAYAGDRGLSPQADACVAEARAAIAQAQ